MLAIFNLTGRAGHARRQQRTKGLLLASYMHFTCSVYIVTAFQVNTSRPAKTKSYRPSSQGNTNAISASDLGIMTS